MDDLLREVLTETNESLGTLDTELVKLERTPGDPALVGGIFRLVHTIKGTCGFLGLPRLERVAHAGENVLGRVRDGTIVASPAAVSLVLAALDRIKAIVAQLEATGAEPEGDAAELIRRLDELLAGPAEEMPAAPPAEAEPAAAHEPEAPKPAGDKVPDSAVAAQSIRVNVGLLENLMTMVSELVLTRNQLLQILRGQKESEFAAPLQRLNHITSELQESVMKTRMQPIGSAWGKLPRLVRDLSRELGKRIELEMLGADTELDRQVLELIKDPLTHMVRNSADHGLEAPAERVAAGKGETGRIRLNAYHEGGQIVIEIGDDGRGLPIDRIRDKALRQGLASEGELAGMSAQQIAAFIFRAGFSTASAVTNVSGRGVGMDVVRTNIEQIGGTIALDSVPGRGTTFMIRIPLTLAIVSALILECAGERFAIPQIGVLELVRAGPGTDLPIQSINGARFIRLRNRLLPLVSLREQLRLGSETERGGEATFVVVSQVGNHSFGIMVDRVFDTEEIVVKPVAPILRDVAMFAGNTILGDGSVIMIIDPNGIVAAVGAAGDAKRGGGAPAPAADVLRERTALLLFKAGAGAPKAVPLALVARLEEIDPATIEHADGRPVVQYRGGLMPLVPADPGQAIAGTGKRPVLVFADGTRAMSLVADEIVDIVEEELRVQVAAARPGLIGSAIVAGQATDLIDVQHHLGLAFADWFGGARGRPAADARPREVLLVDDSPFFRNLLSPVLQVAGYRVTTAENGSEALQLCRDGRGFDAVVSDIEMPGIDGFELAETLRRDRRWQATPIVALSARRSDADVARGRAAGFTDYIVKHDRDALLDALSAATSDRSAA